MFVHRLGLTGRNLDLQHTNLLVLEDDSMVLGCGCDCFEITRRACLTGRKG